jgi:RimJ/RimL family protein N-acetyltransferase
MKLVEPDLDCLASYVAALRRGWTYDNHRGEDAIREDLARIESDPRAFVASHVDREAKGPPIVLPDGSHAKRLPSFRLWMWDGEFCGAIQLRWAPGTHALPPTCLGHIGYGVVPWKRRRGYATRALALLRPRVRREGLTYADIVADAANAISHKVMLANGAFAFQRFRAPASCGGADCLRFRWYAGDERPIERDTARLRLRQWREADRAPFAALNGDREVMAHFPSALTRSQSHALHDRLRDALAHRGFGLWAVERREDARFLGFVGLMPAPDELPFAPAVEIGWRLARAGGGAGYATQDPRETLGVAVESHEQPQLGAVTASTNERSAAVMRRLGMREDRPFEHPRVAPGHRLRAHRLFRIARGDFLRAARSSM